MDDLDLAILRSLRIEPFQGAPRDPTPWRPQTLAKEVKANPRLVKDRLRRLRPLIEGFDVMPNLALLGVWSRTYVLNCSTRDQKRRVLEGVRDVEGLLGQVEFLSNCAVVSFAERGPAEIERKQNLLARLSEGARVVAVFEVKPWTSALEPSRLDWRVIRAFRGNARRTIQAVARNLRVARRTVERRLQRLAREAAFDTFVRLRPRALDELLFCCLLFRFEPGRVADAMTGIHASLLANTWSRCDAANPQQGTHCDLVAAPRSPGEFKQPVRQAEAIPGVAEVEAHLASSITWAPEWIDQQIDARIADGRAPGKS